MSASPANPARWLFGPVPDLLLGCGGLYALVLFAFAIAGPELRGAEAAWLGPLLVLLLGAPHYGATLLRVYEQRTDRRAYVIFSVYATLAIVAAFALSLFNWVAATWLVTIYLTWSPWHYTGQNYGLAVMFLRRRGVPISANAKRSMYASFVISYALTFLVFHGDIGSAPSPEFASGPRSMFVAIGMPSVVMTGVFPLLLAAYAVTLAGAGLLLARGASLRDLVPTIAVILSQALWFTVPMALRHWRVHVGVEPFDWQMRDYYFFWIALGHSTQYLWVTTYYARQSDGWHGFGGYLAKVLVAGMAVWTLPVLLLDPGRVGVLPNTATLTLLVASAVNIHHFVLDGAIWKLRHSRVAAVLIRSADSAEEPDAAAGSASVWPRRVAWSLAGLGAALAIFQYSHQDVLLPIAVEKNDYAAARSILERIDWILDVSDEAWVSLAAAEADQKRMKSAYDRRLQQRLGLYASGDPTHQRAQAYAQQGDWRAAARAYQEGLEREPNDPVLLLGAGRAWLEIGAPERAVDYLERAVALRPDDGAARASLIRARKLLGQKRAP